MFVVDLVSVGITCAQAADYHEAVPFLVQMTNALDTDPKISYFPIDFSIKASRELDVKC